MFNQQSVLNTDQLFVSLRQVTEYTYTHTDTPSHTLLMGKTQIDYNLVWEGNQFLLGLYNVYN